MKRYNALRLFAIVSYVLIIFKGMIIGMPLGLCLLGWIFDPDTISQQLYSIGAIAGLAIIVSMVKKRNTNKRILFETTAFILLLLPIVGRMAAIPISLFNYGAFYIPAVSFIVLYLLSLLFSYKKVTN